MKTKPLTFAIALSTLAFTLSAQGHDPSEHMEDAEKPDCSAMENMDHDKMDGKDPVMLAMAKKCMKDMHNDEDPDYPGLEQSEPEGHAKGEESPEHKHG